MSPAKREAKRLRALPAGEAGPALRDLLATPGARFSARFVHELFYGRTEAEALAKAREFAAECGPDMLRTFEDEGAAVHPLPTD